MDTDHPSIPIHPSIQWILSMQNHLRWIVRIIITVHRPTTVVIINHDFPYLGITSDVPSNALPLWLWEAGSEGTPGHGQGEKTRLQVNNVLKLWQVWSFPSWNVLVDIKSLLRMLTNLSAREVQATHLMTLNPVICSSGKTWIWKLCVHLVDRKVPCN